MKSYNVSKIKEKFSSALRDVANGEEIVVTDHNRPVAKLVPLHHLSPVPKVDIKALLQWVPLSLKRGVPSSADLIRKIRDEEVH